MEQLAKASRDDLAGKTMSKGVPVTAPYPCLREAVHERVMAVGIGLQHRRQAEHRKSFACTKRGDPMLRLE